MKNAKSPSITNMGFSRSSPLFHSLPLCHRHLAVDGLDNACCRPLQLHPHAGMIVLHASTYQHPLGFSKLHPPPAYRYCAHPWSPLRHTTRWSPWSLGANSICLMPMGMAWARCTRDCPPALGWCIARMQMYAPVPSCHVYRGRHTCFIIPEYT
jgi:hypothetical protein